MKITLRDAHKLDTKIKNKLREGYKLRHSMSIYQDEAHNDANWLATAEEATDAAITQHLNLISARYSIRSDVQAMNEQVGISLRITDRIQLRDTQAILREVIELAQNEEIAINADYLKGRREAMAKKGNGGEYYGSSSDRFTVVTIGDETYADMRAHLKHVTRKLENIENELASLNAGTKIVLADSIVELLEETDLL